VSFEFKDRYNVYDLVEIVKRLRAPDGCPWDKVQTHPSIRNDFIEEVYEAIEAIDEEDTEHLREELGDVLLQVVFHCEIESEQNHFNLDDAADEVCKKMILRHPHVFGQVIADTPEEVIKNWDEIKMRTKSQNTASEAMEGVSKALPSLMRSKKLWKKAESAGASLGDVDAAVSLTKRKLEALEKAIAIQDQKSVEQTIGELLFSVSGLSRLLHTDCEESLYRACDAFIARFRLLETEAASKNIDIQNMSSEEVAKLWNETFHH